MVKQKLRYRFATRFAMLDYTIRGHIAWIGRRFKVFRAFAYKYMNQEQISRFEKQVTEELGK